MTHNAGVGGSSPPLATICEKPAWVTPCWLFYWLQIAPSNTLLTSGTTLDTIQQVFASGTSNIPDKLRTKEEPVAHAAAFNGGEIEQDSYRNTFYWRDYAIARNRK
jgi:hypothetical protein